MYLVFRCGGCGRHLYALEGTKSRTCPCGKRIKVSLARILARAEDAREAGEIVRTLQLQDREMRGFSPAG
jgi:hypothetical protein